MVMEDRAKIPHNLANIHQCSTPPLVAHAPSITTVVLARQQQVVSGAKDNNFANLLVQTQLAILPTPANTSAKLKEPPVIPATT